MIKIIVIALMGFSCNLHARSLSQLQGDSRLLARDANSNTRQRFSDSEVTNFLNQGQRESISRTTCIEKSFTFQLSRGTTYYPVPSDFLTVRRVTRGSMAMTELTPAGLDGRSRGWETASGKPTYYFQNWSSRALVGFSPWPAMAADTDTVKMDYFAMTQEMASASDQPFNNIAEFYDYHQMLSYYAASRMTAIDGRVALTGLYMQIYDSYVKNMELKCRNRPNYMPSLTAIP